MRKEKQREGLLTLRHKLTPSYLFILTYHSMPPFVSPLHQIFPFFVPFTYHTYIHKWFFSNKMFSILKNKRKSEVLALLGSYFHSLFLTSSYSDFLLYSNNLKLYFVWSCCFVLLYHKLHKNQTISHTAQTQNTWQLPNEYNFRFQKINCFLISNFPHNITWGIKRNHREDDTVLARKGLCSYGRPTEQRQRRKRKAIYLAMGGFYTSGFKKITEC